MSQGVISNRAMLCLAIYAIYFAMLTYISQCSQHNIQLTCCHFSDVMHLNLSLSSPCHIYRARSCVRFFIGLCRHMRRAATTRHRFLPLLRRARAPACYSYTPSLASCSCLCVFIRHLLFSSLDTSRPHNAIHTTYLGYYVTVISPTRGCTSLLYASRDIPQPAHSAAHACVISRARCPHLKHLPSDSLSYT